MAVKLHPDIFLKDLPKLKNIFPVSSDFNEVSDCFDVMIERIERNHEEGSPCKRPPLIGWRKIKFHSKLRSPQGMKADLRVVFRVKEQDIEVLCVGKRMVGDPNDVYQDAHRRDQNTW